MDSLLVSTATYWSPCRIQNAPSFGAWSALVGYTAGSISVLLLSENIRTVLCPDRVYHINALASTSTTKNPSGRGDVTVANDEDDDELPCIVPSCSGLVSVCLQHTICVSVDSKTAVGSEDNLNCSNMLMVKIGIQQGDVASRDPPLNFQPLLDS